MHVAYIRAGPLHDEQQLKINIRSSSSSFRSRDTPPFCRSFQYPSLRLPCRVDWNDTMPPSGVV